MAVTTVKGRPLSERLMKADIRRNSITLLRVAPFARKYPKLNALLSSGGSTVNGTSRSTVFFFFIMSTFLNVSRQNLTFLFRYCR